MILFDLLCSQGHGFEAWFRDSGSYERLVAAGEVQCTICGDSKVKKALMAPAVRTAKAPTPMLAPSASPAQGQGLDKADEGITGSPPAQGEAGKALVGSSEEASASTTVFPEKMVEAMRMLRQAQNHIEKNFDHVGKSFAEEARKMHYGETEKRSIYGEATREDAETLAEEGIEINQIPWLPSHDS